MNGPKIRGAYNTITLREAETLLENKSLIWNKLIFAKQDLVILNAKLDTVSYNHYEIGNYDIAKNTFDLELKNKECKYFATIQINDNSQMILKIGLVEYHLKKVE